MNIDERIKYAEAKRNEAIKNDDVSEIIAYWNGSIDALKVVRKLNG